jgi:hypothetical protein
MHEAQIGGDPFPAALVVTAQKIMHNRVVTTDSLFHWSLVSSTTAICGKEKDG